MYQFARRVLCAIVCGGALIVLLSVFLTTIIGILISGWGSVFYRANHIGKDNKSFRIYKFRNMTTAKDADEKSFRADMNHILRWDTIMHATKIDELPQLLNCVLGDMAIVGPRPAVQDQVVIMRESKYGIVARVRPGLTGPATLYNYLYGDTVESPVEYVEKVLPTHRKLGAFYVHHVNVGFDSKMAVWAFLCVLGKVAGKPQNWILKKLEGHVE